MQDEISTRRFVVTGHVQGVGYRFFAVAAAEICGLTGFVRNLPDRSVEVIANGIEGDLDRFRAMLSSGPDRARVAGVHVEEVAGRPQWASFDIR